MIAYSKYRRVSISENTKAIICAIVICFLWATVSEMDYQEQTRIEVCK